MLTRFYVPQPLTQGAAVALPEATAHHIGKVLRLAVGTEVTLFDARGGEWRAQLARQDKQLGAQLCAIPLEFRHIDRNSPLTITLAQALPAADKMDWLVQKSVELGVSAIQPVATQRSVVRLSGERMERRCAHWQQIVIAACAQCGRNSVPQVAHVKPLPQLLTDHPPVARWVLLPDAPTRLRDLPPPTQPIQLLVGPEGGFEEREVQLLTWAKVTPIALGPRVLRTETAGLAALAAMQALWGDG